MRTPTCAHADRAILLPVSRRFRDWIATAIAAAFSAAAWTTVLPAQPQIAIQSVENRSAGGSKTFCEGIRCFVAKGHTLLIRVTAPGIAQAGFVTDNSGSLTTTLTGYKVPPNLIELQVFATADGSRGEKTIKVQHKVGSTVTTEWPLSVRITNNGQVTSAPFPGMTDFFTEASITVTGADLGNAKAFVPNAVSPRPTISVLSNTSTSMTLRATYSTPQSAPNLQIVLCDDQVTAFGCPLSWTTLSGQIKGPPAIKVVAIPNTPKVGSDISMEFQLTSAAPQGGEQVWWRFSSPTDFARSSKACAYDATALKNTFTISAGNSTFTCSVRVVSAGGVGPVTRTLEVWVVNPDRFDAPYYYKRDFTITSM